MDTNNRKVAAALVAGLSLAITACVDESASQGNSQASSEETKRLRMQVEELEHDLKKAKSQNAGGGETGAPSPDDQQQIRKLLEEAEQHEEEMEALKKEFSDYKTKYRVSVRQKIIGRKIAKLSTEKEDYEDVVVKEVTAVGLRISHKQGSGRIRFEDLSQNLQEQLGYDAEEARQQLEREMEARAVAAARAAEVAEKRGVERAETQKLMDRTAEGEMRKEVARLDAWIPNAENQVANLEREARSFDSKHSSARARGHSSSWSMRAKAKRTKATKLRSQIARTNMRIAELRASLNQN